ncbi:MAG: aspartyl/asparaginyl beta-hydroxylase domain-containing protein, partial [Bauldia sp.]
MPGLYDRASNLVRRIYNRRIDAPAILDIGADFPNAVRFVTAWRAIRDEAIAARIDRMPRFHELMPEQADISANDGRDWRMLILKAYGVDVPENIARAPTMRRLLEECPEVKSAIVSFLAP